MNQPIFAALLFALCASGAHASCYTVYNAKGAAVLTSSNPPVDMSEPLHVRVPPRFGPGASMVFALDATPCMDTGMALLDASADASAPKARKSARKKAKAKKRSRKAAR